MNSVQAFLALMHALQTTSESCVDRTESTHSVIVYGGNCLQAFWVSVFSPGVAMIFGS